MVRGAQPADPHGTSLKKLGGRFVLPPKPSALVAPTGGPSVPHPERWQSRRIFADDDDAGPIPAPTRKRSPAQRKRQSNGDRPPRQRNPAKQRAPRTRKSAAPKQIRPRKKPPTARRSDRIHENGDKPNYRENSGDESVPNSFLVENGVGKDEEEIEDESDYDYDDDDDGYEEEEDANYVADIQSDPEDVIRTEPRYKTQLRERKQHLDKQEHRKRKRVGSSHDKDDTVQRKRKKSRSSSVVMLDMGVPQNKPPLQTHRQTSVAPDSTNHNVVRPTPAAEYIEPDDGLPLPKFVVVRPASDKASAGKIGALYHRIMMYYPSEDQWRRYLYDVVVGQTWAVEHLASILSSIPVRLADENTKPTVILISGSSGAGKTTMIREILKRMRVENTPAHVQRSGTQFVDETTTSNVVGAADGLAKCESESALMPSIAKAAAYAEENGTLVVLEIDEAHLAHTDVWGAWMGLLGEGLCTSGANGHAPKKIRNLVVIMAANWGEPQITKRVLAAEAYALKIADEAAAKDAAKCTNKRRGQTIDNAALEAFFGKHKYTTDPPKAVATVQPAVATNNHTDDADEYFDITDARALGIESSQEKSASDDNDANGHTTNTVQTYPTPEDMVEYIRHDMQTKRDRYDKRPILTPMHCGRIDEIIPVGPMSRSQVVDAVRRDIEKLAKAKAGTTGYYIRTSDDTIAQFISKRISITKGFRPIHSTVIAIVGYCIEEARKKLHIASPLFIRVAESETEDVPDRVRICMTVGMYKDAYQKRARHIVMRDDGETEEKDFPEYTFSMSIPLS